MIPRKVCWHNKLKHTAVEFFISNIDAYKKQKSQFLVPFLCVLNDKFLFYPRKGVIKEFIEKESKGKKAV